MQHLIESIKSNIVFLEANLDSTVDWLKKHLDRA